jgi:hypothetical protein
MKEEGVHIYHSPTAMQMAAQEEVSVKRGSGRNIE